MAKEDLIAILKGFAIQLELGMVDVEKTLEEIKYYTKLHEEAKYYEIIRN